MGLLGSIIGGIFGLGQAAAENRYATERERIAREENYKYGEMAADNADARTRALYNDFQSPEAMMRQYRAAGISPSYALSAGNIGAGGISQGAQGNGVNVNPQVFGLQGLESALMAAQVKKTDAETEKINEETENVSKDTELKDMIKNIKNIEWEQMNISNQVMTSYVDINGKRESLYEFAGSCSSFENFIHKLRKTNSIDDMTLNSEVGQQTLREIWTARGQLSRDIAVLSEEEINADFQKSIIKTLNDNNFAKMNAESVVGYLKANIATNELTESQKNAWNNMLDELEKKSPTLKNVAIILGIIVDKFAHNANINMDLSKKTFIKN